MFSSPQQHVASITNNEPKENLKLPLPSNERTILDNVINPMAIHSLDVTTSLNIKRAMSVVATISKFPSNDAFEAEPIFIPIIKNIGAKISRTIIPTVYGKSVFDSFSIFFSLFELSRYIIPTPIPAPRYKKEAINVGVTFSNRIFEKGVFIA